MCLGEVLEEQEQKDWKSSFFIPIDYDVTLEEMAIKADCFVETSPDEEFPSSRNGKRGITVELVQFEKWVRTEEAEKLLYTVSLRPCSIEELCAFAKAHPDFQRQFPIIAIGSSILYNYLISSLVLSTCFVGALRKRSLAFLDRKYSWGPTYRFLATPL